MPKSKPRIQRRKTKVKYNREDRYVHFYTPYEWKEYKRLKLGIKRKPK